MTFRPTSLFVRLCAASVIVTWACETPKQREPYAPVFAVPTAGSAVAEQGTLSADFDKAARSATLEEAASRWQAFLATHTPADGEIEDEYAANRLKAATYELVRVYYLLHLTGKGDSVLKHMNPLAL